MVGLASAGILGLGLVDCAEPTQIVIEVYSDACPGTPAKTQKINSTGIAVGTAADIDTRAPSAVREGCERAPGVGTLTIYPSGDKDSEVAIRVLAGVENTPDRCLAPDFAGCIVHRRVLRFKPNETVRAVVRLSLACLNRKCAEGQTCDDGVCKSAGDILDDGGTKQDSAAFEAGLLEGSTISPGVDAAADACFGCAGDCDQSQCTVNCGPGGCDAANHCAPNLPCTINCSVQDKCPDIQCVTSSKCTVNCTARDACRKVTCAAADCKVACTGDRACENAAITLDGGAEADLECRGSRACANATAACNSPDCQMKCDPIGGPMAACPPAGSTPCSGGCDDWNTRQPFN